VPALRPAQVNYEAQTVTILLLSVSLPLAVVAAQVGMTATVHLLVTEVQAVEVRVVGCPAALLEAQPVPELPVKDLQALAAALIGILVAAVVLGLRLLKQVVKLHTVAPVY
jgi:hypothetical protein